MKPPVSVVLIRGIGQQISGGGCCGLWHHDSASRDRNPSCRAKEQQRQLDTLHRAIRRSFPEAAGRRQVALVTVDPRNHLYLVPKLLADVVRYRPGWRAGVQTVLQMFSLPAVVLNGRVIGRKGLPVDPDTLCRTIGELLDDACHGTSGRTPRAAPTAGRRTGGC